MGKSLRSRNLQDYLEEVRRRHLCPASMRFVLSDYLNYLFGSLSFKGKRILDVGAGTGLYSLYGLFMGADEVVSLEPSLDGSSPLPSRKLFEISRDYEGIVPLNETFQGYDSCHKAFDIVLLHNSINHLDEVACLGLDGRIQAKCAYDDIFGKIWRLTSSISKVIIADCSRNNLFGDYGIRSPFSLTIEWEKHQPPEVWEDFALRNDFVLTRLCWWNPLWHLSLGGRFKSVDHVLSYSTSSHFSMTLDKR